jgi:hypothetical protein
MGTERRHGAVAWVQPALVDFLHHALHGGSFFAPSLWKDTPDFTYDPKVSFFSMLVPTVDTVVRYSFVFTKSLLFTGQ